MRELLVQPRFNLSEPRFNLSESRSPASLSGGSQVLLVRTRRKYHAFPDSQQLAAEGSELMGIWEHWGDRGLISKLIHP
mgnify:CR=1 FL=1